MGKPILSCSPRCMQGCTGAQLLRQRNDKWWISTQELKLPPKCFCQPNLPGWQDHTGPGTSYKLGWAPNKLSEFVSWFLVTAVHNNWEKAMNISVCRRKWKVDILVLKNTEKPEMRMKTITLLRPRGSLSDIWKQSDVPPFTDRKPPQNPGSTWREPRRTWKWSPVHQDTELP